MLRMIILSILIWLSSSDALVKQWQAIEIMVTPSKYQIDFDQLEIEKLLDDYNCKLN